MPDDVNAPVSDPVAVWREFCAEARIRHDGTMETTVATQGGVMVMDARRMCHDLQQSMGALFTCSEQGDHLRIRTPFLYPDGDNIDIFCKMVDDTVTVSDSRRDYGLASDAVRRAASVAEAETTNRRYVCDARHRVLQRNAPGEMSARRRVGAGRHSGCPSGAEGIRPVVHFPDAGDSVHYGRGSQLPDGAGRLDSTAPRVWPAGRAVAGRSISTCGPTSAVLSFRY